MAFELNADEKLRKSLRNVVRKQLRRAEADFSQKHPGGRDEAVHDARKRLKRVRALLRLVRPAVGEIRFARENREFRDAGRPLSEVRDAKVLVETLDKLTTDRPTTDKPATTHDATVDPERFSKVRKALRSYLKETRRRVLDEEGAFSKLTRIIRRARRRTRSWTDVPNRWMSLGTGIERTYDEARTAMEKAIAEPTADSLHEWRKQAKHLRYQLEFISPLWEPRISELAGEADRMGTLLGDDHDLAVLERRLSNEAASIDDAEAIDLVRGLAARRLAELQAEAILLGRSFFAELPDAFAQPLKVRWKTRRQVETPLEEPQLVGV